MGGKWCYIPSVIYITIQHGFNGVHCDFNYLEYSSVDLILIARTGSSSTICTCQNISNISSKWVKEVKLEVGFGGGTNHLMSNWCGVYAGKGHVNSRLTLLRLFPFHKLHVLNFPRNIWRGFHLVGKNLVCFNCLPFPDSFPCESLRLNFQWLTELLTSWSILLQVLTVAYLQWFYTFCRIRDLLTVFIHFDHQTWTYSCVVLS